ncbi:MAG: AMP-binding protein [Pseudolabrys sp.]
MHSDNSLLANARDMVRDWGHGPHTKLLSLSPLSHHIAWVAVAQWLLAGCLLITDDPPAGTTRLGWIVETGATYVMGVPTHAMDVLAEQRPGWACPSWARSRYSIWQAPRSRHPSVRPSCARVSSRRTSTA